MLTRIILIALPVVLAFAVVSCDRDGGTAPETLPDITGTYSASFQLRYLVGGVSDQHSCHGTVTIAYQDGEVFFGGFSIPTPCDPPIQDVGADGGTFSGVIDTDGDISTTDLFDAWLNFDPAGVYECSVMGGSKTFTGRKLSEGFSLGAHTELLCGLWFTVDADIAADSPEG